MENIEWMIALIAVVIECFAFAIALALANEFFATIYEVAPRRRERTRHCARCSRRFTTDADAAYCGFCAVIVVYEHYESTTNLLAPGLPGVCARARN
jgi:uncharacterized paraquat-inducible protein A